MSSKALSNAGIAGPCLVLALIAASAGCTTMEEKKASSLEPAQVREYKGEKLSSINDFRENSIRGPQYIDASNYTLAITGMVGSERHLGYEEVLSFPAYSKAVTLNCVEGWSVSIFWEGVRVRDLVDSASPGSGANTIIFKASDGYSTSFPLEWIYGRDILIAYKMNNVTLPPEKGFPFQLVAEDKWGYKWIKWVTEIEISNNSGYRGFWEQYGYSQSGDLDKPKLEGLG